MYTPDSCQSLMTAPSTFVVVLSVEIPGSSQTKLPLMTCGRFPVSRGPAAPAPGPGIGWARMAGMVYRYFYDCEFIEDGVTIDLVSIGVVDEEGREFYAVSTEFDPERAGPWVRQNVLNQLPSPADKAWRSRERIREDLLDFLGARNAARDEVELWAWFAAYDHVALAQLWGAMPALPRALPRFTRDLRQRWDDVGRPKLPAPPVDAHDALADARHNLARWKVIEEHRRKTGFPVR